MYQSDAPIVMPEDLTSGKVPRELVKGVVWDAQAEDKFLDAVRSSLNGNRLRLTLEDAVKEARWLVDAWLYRRMWFKAMSAASACKSPAEKQRVAKEWIAQYGRKQAQAFGDSFQNKKFVEMTLARGAD